MLDAGTPAFAGGAVALALSGYRAVIYDEPWRLSTSLQCHQKLVHGNSKWKGRGGLEIMTMIGRKR